MNEQERRSEKIEEEKADVKHPAREIPPGTRGVVFRDEQRGGELSVGMRTGRRGISLNATVCWPD